ncbi:MAG: AtzE family amidohydrolase [Rhodospirillales bacterium]
MTSDGDALALAAAVRSGATTAAGTLDSALARIAAIEPQVQAFNAVTEAPARVAARHLDAAVAAGRDPGPLAGVPFAAKALFDVAGLPTHGGSVVRAGAPPAERDAAAVARLTAAGAVLAGITNMDEFAFGFTTENSHYGATRNPHDAERVAGGSSGGSAAAVAAGMVPVALGSDTNGSVRVPAALCGVFGLKPTYGRVSRAGAAPLAWSFDHVGWFARSVRDLAILLDLTQGHDPRDPASAERVSPPAAPAVTRGTQGLRIAVAGGHFAAGAEPAALAAVAKAAAALGATRQVELPEVPRAIAASLLISAAEGASLHLDELRTRAGEFDPQTRDRWLAATMIPAAWIHAAQRFRRGWREAATAALADVDVLITPTTPFAAPRIGQMTIRIGAAEMPVRGALGRFTAPFSFIGVPALSAPVWLDGPLPYGVQLVGKPFDDEAILRAAAALEAAGVARAPVAAP